MRRIYQFSLAALATGALAYPLFKATPEGHFAPYNQASFSAYVQQQQDWLSRERHFLTSDTEREVAINSPFESRPTEHTSRAILLVHGLSDSPYSFADIARKLNDKGIAVRTLLLPGHGTAAEDLLHVDYQHWQLALQHHLALLKQDYSEVWLGGFSTGANLVTALGAEDEQVRGLVLFSPAFGYRNHLAALAPLAARYIDWIDIDPEQNIARYDSMTTNAAGLFYRSSQEVAKVLDKGIEKPVFLVASEADGVVDNQQLLSAWQQQFHAENNQLVWYHQGSQLVPGANNYTMRLDQQRISSGSHMGVMFSKANALYGSEGEVTVCNNDQSAEHEAACLRGEPMWFSGWGYREAGRAHARLTWNPYFEPMLEQLAGWLEQTAANP